MIKFSAFYATGQVMGFSPRVVDDLTIWEFNAAFEGYKAANGIKPKGEGISEARAAELGIVGF